ncbi:MAG: c-type cytochrome [Trueperaceae bacterium]|nr:MAG: c-type cytochrome [Trueperaceae bacterium]
MDQNRHEAIAKWERRWLALSGLLALLFVLLIAYSLAIEGGHIAQRSGRASPEELTSHELFQDPGVRAMGPNRFQVTMVAQAFSFDPAEIVLPQGAEVTFFVASKDVLHGYQLQNTGVNVELIPGEIASFRATFDKLGEFRVTCNEYCGIGHHNMLGKVTVLPASQYAQYQRAEVSTQAAGAEEALGESVYTANCSACHQATGQGLVGAFPPLQGHAVDLYGAEGGREYLIDVLLYGLQGPITVAGTSYSGVMPAWQQLGDEEIAAVLNYALTAWGNDAVLPGGIELYRAEEITARRGTGLSPQDVYERRQTLALE